MVERQKRLFLEDGTLNPDAFGRKVRIRSFLKAVKSGRYARYAEYIEEVLIEDRGYGKWEKETLYELLTTIQGVFACEEPETRKGFVASMHRKLG